MHLVLFMSIIMFIACHLAIELDDYLLGCNFYNKTVLKKCSLLNFDYLFTTYLHLQPPKLSLLLPDVNSDKMALIQIKDAGGNTMELVDIDGYYLCTFLKTPEEMAKNVLELKNFKCRPDDIFICAPMKSGTHWTWEIISMLCNRKAETIPKSKTKNMLECTNADKFDDLPSPRVLNTHVCFKYIPKEVEKMNCKIVFVLRNPKDVMVSHYNHVIGIKAYKYDGKWENFFRLFMEGNVEYNSWFEFTKDWYDIIKKRKDLKIHVVYYEDVKQNTLQEVSRLGEFLGIENKDDLFEAITKKVQFDEMTPAKVAAYKPEERTMFFKGDFTMFRKGEHGDWMNWFTVAQSEYFDKVFDERMDGVDLNFRFRPNKPQTDK